MQVLQHSLALREESTSSSAKKSTYEQKVLKEFLSTSRSRTQKNKSSLPKNAESELILGCFEGPTRYLCLFGPLQKKGGVFLESQKVVFRKARNSGGIQHLLTLVKGPSGNVRFAV